MWYYSTTSYYGASKDLNYLLGRFDFISPQNSQKKFKFWNARQILAHFTK